MSESRRGALLGLPWRVRPFSLLAAPQVSLSRRLRLGPGGMFRKARRVNVRKRNESEEEDEARDEELQPPPPLQPPGGDGPAGEAAPPPPKPPLLPLPAGCVPLVSPGGGGGGGGGPGGFGFGGSEAIGRGGGGGGGLTGLTASQLLPQPPSAPPASPPPPSQLQLPPGNNGLVSAAAKAKERRNRSKEALVLTPTPTPPPRGSLKLLSFQDEEEGKGGTVACLSFLPAASVSSEAQGAPSLWAASARAGRGRAPPPVQCRRPLCIRLPRTVFFRYMESTSA